MVSMWYILKKSNNWNGSPITSVGYFLPKKLVFYHTAQSK